MKNFKPDYSTACHLLAIVIIGAIVYSNTLTAPFQFDDKLNIADNLLIRNISNFWPPTGNRWFGLLTFSLNYQAGGLNPFGYHLVNICIHLVTALSVYMLVRLTFKTCFFSGYRGVVPDGWIACACALLFVVHPIQTQAVTYIVQRFASLTAMLYVLALDFYILARLQSFSNDKPFQKCFRCTFKGTFLYAAAGIFLLLSLKTKENAFTLPFVIVLYEVTFISNMTSALLYMRQKWRVVLPVFLTTLFAFTAVTLKYNLLSLLGTYRATEEISRHDYLITQFRVIVTYLRLLVLPINQTVDHYYQVYRTVFEPVVLASLILILFLICLAGFLFKLSQYEDLKCLRLISFGILWFFMTLSVESSIIPINDVMFEHRLYLPGIGAMIAVVAAFVYLLERGALEGRCFLKPAAFIFAALIIVLSAASYQRNKVWNSEVSLWNDAIAKKPRNPRAYNMVGNYYLSVSKFREAIPYFIKSLDADSSYAEARSNLGIAYIRTGRINDGLKELMTTAISNRFDAIDAGILYYNIGYGLLAKGMVAESIENLNTSLVYMPNEAPVYSLLGEAYRQNNMMEKSAASIKKAHELDPLRF